MDVITPIIRLLIDVDCLMLHMQSVGLILSLNLSYIVPSDSQKVPVVNELSVDPVVCVIVCDELGENDPFTVTSPFRYILPLLVRSMLVVIEFPSPSIPSIFNDNVLLWEFLYNASY